MSNADQRSPAPRVCVRMPNWVGDVVMATPVLRALRAGLPEATIDVVIRRNVAPILRRNPRFDALIPYGPGQAWAPREFARCVSRLRRAGYDLGVLLPNSFSSALMFALAGVERRAGYVRDMRGFMLTDALQRPSQNGRFKPTYMVDYYLALCEAVGIPVGHRRMELHYAEEDAVRARGVLAQQGRRPEQPLALLHPGAGYGPSKRWPQGRWAALADAIVEEFGAQAALIGGPGEKALVRQIRERAHADVLDLCDCGVDLHLLKCVVADSRLLVTTDSGPRHYGVALGVETICLMGPTHPGYSTSHLPHDHVVRLDADCGPCQKKVCPRDHRCMEDITVEMVLEVCRGAMHQMKGPTSAHD